MARKKIVFVIVEGPSDQDALAVILSRLYSNNEVYVHVVHGDITTQFNETPQENIFTKVAGEIIHYAENNYLNKSDFKEIIHIVDTDGTYIPDDSVIEDDSAEQPLYSLTEIRTKNKKGIESRKGYGKEIYKHLENIYVLNGISNVWLTADPVTGEPFWSAVGFTNSGKKSPENNLYIYEKTI